MTYESGIFYISRRIKDRHALIAVSRDLRPAPTDCSSDLLTRIITQQHCHITLLVLPSGITFIRFTASAKPLSSDLFAAASCRA